MAGTMAIFITCRELKRRGLEADGLPLVETKPSRNLNASILTILGSHTRNDTFRKKSFRHLIRFRFVEVDYCQVGRRSSARLRMKKFVNWSDIQCEGLCLGFAQENRRRKRHPRD